MLAAFDEGVERVSQIIGAAAECERGWRERVRAALVALLGFLDEHPSWARLLILDPPIGTLAVSERRRRVLGELAEALNRETSGRATSSAAFTESSQVTAELVVGGVYSVVRAHLLEESYTPLAGLAPSLHSFIAASYQRLDQAPADRHLPVRVTYRTSQVLRAIGAAPRSNNREIAEAAGLRDEGQTSKLLRRLEQRGLVRNLGLGAAHGEPNAWLLTPQGERVLAATEKHVIANAGRRRGRPPRLVA